MLELTTPSSTHWHSTVLHLIPEYVEFLLIPTHTSRDGTMGPNEHGDTGKPSEGHRLDNIALALWSLGRWSRQSLRTLWGTVPRHAPCKVAQAVSHAYAHVTLLSHWAYVWAQCLRAALGKTVTLPSQRVLHLPLASVQVVHIQYIAAFRFCIYLRFTLVFR